MTAILRQLPFGEKPDEVSVGLERLRVRPYQIIVWVSVTTRRVLDLPPHAPRLPVILDTGHGGDFSIQERQLTEWAQIPRGQLPHRGRARINEQEVSLHPAVIWLHPNVPGSRDRIADRPAFRIDLEEGIAVHSDEPNYPRVPLLGLRALARERLHLTIDTNRHSIDLRPEDFRTKLLRLLS